MPKPSYKITPRMLEENAGIAQLERDGHDRTTIHKALYDITDGASTPEQRKIIQNLYKRDRSKEPGFKQTRWI